MKLLVVGGRLYNNHEHIADVLAFLHGARPLTHVFGWEKDGAARLACRWAKEHGVPTSWLTDSPPGAPDLVLGFTTSPQSISRVMLFANAGFPVLDAKTGQTIARAA